MTHYFKRFLVTIVLLVGLIMMSVKAEVKNIVSYDVSYKVNNMTCISTVNEAIIMNTLKLIRSKKLPVLFSYSINISQYIDEGNNEFKILVDNAHQFLTPAQIEQAYCEMKVNASTLNPETNQLETKRVLDFKASLKTIEEDGESKVVIVTEKLSDTPLMSDIVRLAESWDIDVYKDGSVIVERPWFQTNLQVNHPHSYFSWVGATPVDVKDQVIRQKALAKYREIIKAIEGRNRNQLKELLEPALSENAEFRGLDRDSYFDLLEEQLFNNLYNTSAWWVMPFKEEEFTFETYGHGKLFAYYYTMDYELSPITWENDFNRVKWFSPKLMYHDGEVKVGAF